MAAKRSARSRRHRAPIEHAFASALRRRGCTYLTDSEYRAQYKVKLAGKPEIIFPQARVIIFVDGCFWHGCSLCERNTGTSEAWRKKIAHNIQRERRVTERLTSEGWTVLRVPEHEIRDNGDRERVADDCAAIIKNL